MNQRAPKRLPARFYRSDSGREPVRQWLKSLEAEDRRTIGEDVRKYGTETKGCRVFVADWHAAGALAGPRAVGGAKQIAARSYRPRDFLRWDKLYGASAWLHKENAENTETGN